MARTKKEITKQDEIIDPETGEVVHFSPDAESILVECERRIKHAAIEMGFVFRRIRDEKLYLLRNCATMEEYLLRTGLAVRTGQMYMQIADRIHMLPDSDALLQAPPAQIIKLIKDERAFTMLKSGDVSVQEGKVVRVDPASGEMIEMPIPEFLKEQRAAWAIENAKKKETSDEELLKLKEMRKTWKTAHEEYRQKEIELYHRIEGLEQTIRKLTSPETDPNDLVIVTTRKQAIDMLHRASVDILEYCGQIERIPIELVDAELAGAISRTLSAIEAGLSRVNETWSGIENPDINRNGEN